MHQQLRRDVQKKLGYSKAVDVWSVGCLAGTLFTNSFLFSKDEVEGEDGHVPSALNSQECKAKYDLGFLDTRPEWNHVSRKAKDFIRNCVMLDESKRLTAKQALLHRWLTHHQYAADLQAAHGRAIADWKPRRDAQDLIEYLDQQSARTEITKDRFDAQLHTDTKSRYFPTGLPPVPQFRSFEPLPQATSKPRHTPLSPLTFDSMPGASPIRPPTAGADLATQEESSMLSAAEGQTYFSIQDFAPPQSLHLLAPGHPSSFSQNGWDMGIGDSIDPRMLDIAHAKTRA